MAEGVAAHRLRGYSSVAGHIMVRYHQPPATYTVALEQFAGSGRADDAGFAGSGRSRLAFQLRTIEGIAAPSSGGRGFRFADVIVGRLYAAESKRRRSKEVGVETREKREDQIPTRRSTLGSFLLGEPAGCGACAKSSSRPPATSSSSFSSSASASTESDSDSESEPQSQQAAGECEPPTSASKSGE